MCGAGDRPSGRAQPFMEQHQARSRIVACPLAGFQHRKQQFCKADGLHRSHRADAREENKKVLFATEGKDASTVQRFREDFVVHRGNPALITECCRDMSPAFIKGITDHFVNSQLTFDKFHDMQIINNAVDEVQRQE